MSTRTWIMRGKDKPGWMVIAPIHPLTPTQWKAAHTAFASMKREDGVWLTWTSAEYVATKSGVSVSTARRTLDKLSDMGLFRKRRSSIGTVYHRVMA